MIIYDIFLQAYTSQFITLVMFALMVSEDRISMSARRKEIMKGLHELPGKVDSGVKTETFRIVINIMAPVRLMHHNRAKHHLRAIHTLISCSPICKVVCDACVHCLDSPKLDGQEN